MVTHHLLHVSGKTIDGKFVIAGAQKLRGTYGIPIDLIIDFFKENNAVIDWVYFINRAKADGMKIRTLRAQLESIMDEEFMKRFDIYAGR